MRDECNKILELLNYYRPIFNGYIKLRKEHVNTKFFRIGWKRVFSEHTGGKPPLHG